MTELQYDGGFSPPVWGNRTKETDAKGTPEREASLFAYASPDAPSQAANETTGRSYPKYGAGTGRTIVALSPGNFALS